RMHAIGVGLGEVADGQHRRALPHGDSPNIVRAKAEKALGDKFDIREFHAEVLKDGSVPLDVLEAKIDRWIASKKG
ncbi:MAG: DUF885 family protein, partial [Lysobacteraceae bacterium]